jgi:hypothetical protein
MAQMDGEGECGRGGWQPWELWLKRRENLVEELGRKREEMRG